MVAPSKLEYPIITTVASSSSIHIDGEHHVRNKETGDGNAASVEYPPLSRLLLIAVGLCLACFMVALDNTIIATAIPRITSVFNSLDDVGWYGSAYLLTSTSLQPSFGIIYANFNLKYIFLFALVLFEVGSVICATAVSSTILIVGRAVAGLGAAGLFSGALSIIAVCVPIERRAVYVSSISSMFGIAGICGPLLGGAFTDKISWRWCFWINLPFGGLAFAAVALFFTMPDRKPESSRQVSFRQKISQIDFLGAAFLIGGVTCLLLALQWGGVNYPWSSPRVWGLFIGFGFSVAVFVAIQIWRQQLATIPPSIMTRRTVLVSAIYSFMFGMATYIHIYYLPFYFQAVKGTSAVGSGVRTIPRVVSVALTNIVIGVAMTATGTFAEFLWVSTAIFVAGAGTLTTLGVNTSEGKWIGYQILAGVGVAPGVQIPIFAVQAVLAGNDTPIGTSLALFFNSLGGALGVSIGQTIFSNALLDYLPKYAPSLDPRLVLETGATQLRQVVPPLQLPGVLEAYAKSIDRAFILPAALGGACWLVSFFIERINVKRRNTS